MENFIESDAPVNPWPIACAAILAPFMEVLDTSIANVALPYIAGNLSSSEDEAIWVLTSYLVANAIVLPASGWISVTFGRKRFYLLSVAIFTITSLFCGLTPTLPLLIFLHVIQGLGGGGLQPTTQAILADVFPKEKRAIAFTLYTLVISLAPTLGPVVGGWLSDNWGWRWIFFLNVPVGVLAYILNQQLQPNDRPSELHAIKVDYIGLGLTAIGFGALQITLDRGERLDWFSSPLIVCCAVATVLGLGLLFCYEWWFTEHPLIQLRLFLDRNFVLASLIVFVTYGVRYASTALFPTFTHDLLGYTATLSGLVLSPGSFTLLCCLPIVALLMNRIDLRVLITVGLFVTSTAFWKISHLSLDASYAVILRLRILESFGVSLFLTPLSVLAYSNLKSGKNDAAASLFGLVRNLGAAIGVSVANTVLLRHTQIHRNYLAGNLVSTSPRLRSFAAAASSTFLRRSGFGVVDAATAALGQLERQLQQQSTVLAYTDCFRGLMWLSITMLPLSWLFHVARPSVHPRRVSRKKEVQDV